MPKKYMIYGIIVIVLVVVGYLVYTTSMKNSQVVETRDFSCPGMTGFTFKYPVFKGWEFVMNRKINNNSCEISLSDPLPSDPFDTIEKKTAEGQPRIVVSIGGPTEKSMMQTFLNPQSISYRKYTTDGYMFLDPTKKRSISVELLGVDKDSHFPRDLFFQTVIESFKLMPDTKSSVLTSADFELELKQTYDFAGLKITNASVSRGYPVDGPEFVRVGINLVDDKGVTYDLDLLLYDSVPKEWHGYKFKLLEVDSYSGKIKMRVQK